MTDFRAVQALNAPLPIVARPELKVAVFNAVQPLKARAFTIVVVFGSATAVSDVQFVNASIPIVVTPLPIDTVFNCVHISSDRNGGDRCIVFKSAHCNRGHFISDIINGDCCRDLDRA